MKEKRTEKTDLLALGPPLFSQKVEINNREQFQAILREIAQLKRHAIAIEADAYQSMFLICRATNRFLAPRRSRMQALVTGLVAFKATLEQKTGAQKSGASRIKREKKRSLRLQKSRKSKAYFSGRMTTLAWVKPGAKPEVGFLHSPRAMASRIS